MAFRNFMGFANNYCIVVLDGYSKHTRSVSFKIRVYEDSSKEEVIAEIPYVFNVRYDDYLGVISTVNSVPETPEEGDTYLVGTNPTGPWESRANAVATFKNGKWRLVDHAEGRTIFIEDTQSVKIRTEDMTWENYSGEYDPDIWDNFFEIELMDNTSYNLLKAIYLYIKTLPEFANIIDV